MCYLNHYEIKLTNGCNIFMYLYIGPSIYRVLKDDIFPAIKSSCWFNPGTYRKGFVNVGGQEIILDTIKYC